MSQSAWPEVAGVCFVAACTAVAIRGWPPTGGDLFEAITAVGTLASAAGAVGIAAWQFNVARRERYARATHAAAGSYLAMGAMVGELRQVARAMESLSQFGGRMSHFEHYVKMFERIRTSYVFAEPNIYGPLGENAGHKLASAMSQLGLLATMLDRAKIHFIRLPARTKREDDFAPILYMLTSVIQLIQDVSEICQKAAISLDSPNKPG